MWQWNRYGGGWAFEAVEDIGPNVFISGAFVVALRCFQTYKQRGSVYFFVFFLMCNFANVPW